MIRWIGCTLEHPNITEHNNNIILTDWVIFPCPQPPSQCTVLIVCICHSHVLQIPCTVLVVWYWNAHSDNSIVHCMCHSIIPHWTGEFTVQWRALPAIHIPNRVIQFLCFTLLSVEELHYELNIYASIKGISNRTAYLGHVTQLSVTSPLNSYMLITRFF